MKKYILGICSVMLLFAACETYIEDDVAGSTSGGTADFTINMIDGNGVVVENTTANTHNHIFTFLSNVDGNIATKTVSSLTLDTAIYVKAGSYDIRLDASFVGGGTASITKSITIDEDLEVGCSGPISLLTGECVAAGKAWTLSEDAGSVKVGPAPYSSEWFTSSGIDPAQASDKYFFFFDDNAMTIDNGGATFSACQGYIADPDYPVPTDLSYTYTLGAGISGEDRITLSDGWMGVEDSGPWYDIISISEEEMVLHTPTKPCDGSPSNGYFTLTLVPAQ